MHAFLLLNERVQLRDPRIRAMLIRSLNHYSGQVRGDAARLLSIGRYSGTLEAVLPLLNDSEVEVKVAASTALGGLGDRRAVTELVRLLKDGASEARAAAVEALGSLRDYTIREAVMPLLHDPSDSVRAAASVALEKLGDVRSFEGLVAALRESGDESSRIEAAHSLGRLGVKGVEPLLNAFDQEGSQVIKAEIVRALGETNDPRAFGPAVKLLDYSEVLNVGVDVLAKLGKPEAIPALEDSLTQLRKQRDRRSGQSYLDFQIDAVEDGLRKLRSAPLIASPSERKITEDTEPIDTKATNESEDLAKYGRVLLHSSYRVAHNGAAGDTMKRSEVAELLVRAEKEDLRIRYLSETVQMILDGKAIDLTPTEMKLLRFVLTKHSPGTLIKNKEAEKIVWGEYHARNIRQLYSELGRKLFGDKWQDYLRPVHEGRIFKEGFNYLWIEALEEETEHPSL